MRFKTGHKRGNRLNKTYSDNVTVSFNWIQKQDNANSVINDT